MYNQSANATASPLPQAPAIPTIISSRTNPTSKRLEGNNHNNSNYTKGKTFKR